MAISENSETNLILRSEIEPWWELPKESNVSDYVLRKIKENSELGIAIENPVTGEVLYYKAFPELSAKVASKFYKLGLRKGDTVIYSTHDPIKLYVLMLGVWRANGTVRSCYPEELGDALVRRITESKATFLVCDSPSAKGCLKAIGSITEWPVKLVIIGDESEETFKIENVHSIQEFYNDDGSAVPEQSSTLEDVALVLPTSGTTGDSKGAIYTHKILLYNIIFHELMPYTDKDREPTIITSRQTHYVGSITALTFITRGRYLLMTSSVNAKTLLKTVDKYKVRSILAFPTYFTGMANHPERSNFNLESLHYLTGAGQVIVPESMTLIKSLSSNLKNFINLYGMTEAGLLTSSANWTALKMDGSCESFICKDYSVGKLPPGSSLKVMDMDDGHLLGPGCKGELCFKSVVTTKGYLGKPEEKEKAFVGGGWIKTGDIGYYDEEGFIYVVDRAKEVFKWNSNHVCPSELENVLLRHPSVHQAAVVGIPGENDEGFVPRGFVVPKNKATVLKQELVEFAENNLPPYKHFKGGLYILPELPMGKTGKVTKKLLAELSINELTVE